MRYTCTTLLLLWAFFSPDRVQAQRGAEQESLLALRAARMLDVRSGQYVMHPVILIRADRIEAVGPALPVPAGTQIIDLGDATLLPGLIDSHTHLLKKNNPRFFDGPSLLLDVTEMSTTERALRGVKMGQEDLEAGITTVRDVGNSGINGAVALREAIDAGWVVGPRVVACTRALAPKGGQFPQLSSEGQQLIEQEYVQISGVEEARKAVRQALYDGADCIKVIVDAGPLTLSLEEMKEIVEEAHRAGKTVAAHAVSERAIQTAAEAGVNSIEHGFSLNEAQARLMAAKGVFLVPNDYLTEVYLMGNLFQTPEDRKASEAGYGGFAEWIRKRLAIAIENGVRIAAGSDMYTDKPGLTRGQASLLIFDAYAEAGMPLLEIIRAATVNASELLGLPNDIGTLEAGKFADIIAVPDDPLADITALQRVQFVMKGGSVVRNDLAR